ncbi:Mfa1 family fimbria major subunit [Porphyromonas gulae]|uniref:Mfa1 family fimbria major subunit n=1 Tax=Porphyromonas gulae TaxID=111105 RepID=UPI00061882AB|nr:Mfa1 family fimbria major subunit [Porphyromonas gulae]KKC51203.1 major fimbrial subunit protein (FimA) [Porphyromonas gulae]
MKLNKLFFVGALLSLGLASCNKEDNGVENSPAVGDTYMSLTMSVPQNSRAGDEDYNPIGDYEGVDKINTLTVYVADATGVEIKEFAANDLAIETNNALLQTHPFQVKSGAKTVYAVINITDDIKATLAAATNQAELDIKYKDAYVAFASGKEIAKLDASKDVIMMTGVPVAQDILPNVSVANAPISNKVNIVVKRAAARVSMTITAAPKPTAAGVYPIMAQLPGGVEKELGALSELKWSAGQYELKYYLQQKDPVLSPAANYIPMNNYSTEAVKHYDYTTLQDRIDVHYLDHAYTTADVPNVKYKFISETTHEDANYKKGNTAYVLVKGKMTPAADMWAAGESAASNGDIFFGLMTGKFYGSEQAATTAGNAKVVTYKEGYVYYYAWVNPDTNNPATWKMAPVRRNNIYNVNISKFTNIGLSGNPFNPDPNDPDQPDPEDPDQPDPDEPLPVLKTYMVTQVTVVPWKVHNYDIVF